MNNIVIAIDGPAASGKGTLAGKVSEQMGYAYMDTGALYRAVAYEIMLADGNSGDKTSVLRAAKQLIETMAASSSPSDVLCNARLKQDDIAQIASKVAAIQEVRDILFDIQRSFADSPGKAYKGAVLDGRDIGTVICPEADIKLFITASTEIRAQRRTKELQSRGIAVTNEAVLEDMRMRDARDAGRDTAPLKPAEDAIVIDTGNLGPDEVLEQALAVIYKKLPGHI